MNDFIACTVDNASPFPAYNIDNAALLSTVESYQARLEQAIKLAELHCKKYAFVPNTTKKNDDGTLTLMRIVAAKDINDDVKKGDFGGWIEKEQNLDHEGKCWVYANACVHGDAKVTDWAEVFGKAIVSDSATISGNAQVSGRVSVFETAKVSGNAKVTDCALVYGDACVKDDAIVCGESIVKDQAVVSGHSVIEGESEIFNNAQVCGNAKVINTRLYDHAKVCGNANIESCAVMDRAKIYGDAVVKQTTVHDDSVICGRASVTNSNVYNDAHITDDAKVYNKAKIVRNAFIYGNAEVYGCEFDGRVNTLDPAISKARQTNTFKKLKYTGISKHDDSLNTDDNVRFLRYIFEQDYINKTVKFDSNQAAAGIYIACDDSTLTPEKRPSPMYITSQVLDSDNIIVTIHSTKLNSDASYCFQKVIIPIGSMKIIPIATNSRSFEVLWELRNLLEWKDPGPKKEGDNNESDT